MKKVSLRKRLIGTVTVISGVVLALVIVMATRTGDVIDFGKEASVKGAAVEVMQDVDRMLFERYQDALVFAASETARSADPVRLIPYLNDLMAAYDKTYAAMIVVNRRGKIVAANTRDATGRPLPNEAMFGADYSQVAWFERATTLDSRGGCAESRDKEGRSCVLADGPSEDSQVSKYFDHSGKVLGFSAPIRNPRTGEIVGVWRNLVSWQDSIVPVLQEQTKRLQSDWLPQLLVSLRDGQGRLLYSPENWSASERGAWSTPTRTTVGRYRIDGMGTALAGKVMEADTPSLGHGRFRGLGWSAVIQVPIGDAVHDFNQLVQVFAILLVGLALVFAWWIIRGTLRTFNAAIRQLHQQSDSLKAASGQLTGASQELAQSATEQASSLQETASSIDEINSMINRSAENAERSIRIAGHSQEAATRGKRVVDDMIRAIGDISDSNGTILRQIEAGNQQLTEIIKVISEIGNKTKVINDIAFQTKLLSFNASVEAARAGEHGKGFAVVAEEVGSLAQMSGNAAKDIGDMLNGSIQTVQNIVDASRGRIEKLIEAGKAKIDSGIQVARSCESVLEEIVRAEAQMNSIINEIANASREQAQGMNEITKAVGQLDQATNRNATIAQQTEEFAEAIARLSKSLKDQVSYFRILMDGGKEDRNSQTPLAVQAAPSRPMDPFTEALTGATNEEVFPSNVIPLRPASADEELARELASLGLTETGEEREHSGSLGEIPLESDPRFKEV